MVASARTQIVAHEAALLSVSTPGQGEEAGIPKNRFDNKNET
jgi:hypothetical protein